MKEYSHSKNKTIYLHFLLLQHETIIEGFMKYIYKVPNICNIDIRGTNACAGGSEGQRNMGNNRRNIEREER